jgi:hypothetical protein
MLPRQQFIRRHSPLVWEPIELTLNSSISQGTVSQIGSIPTALALMSTSTMETAGNLLQIQGGRFLLVLSTNPVATVTTEVYGS